MSSSTDPEYLREVFTEDGALTSAHAAGATICTIPASVFVVLDKHIATVCSYCLEVSNGTLKLLRCSKCCFVRYCSAECQVKDWKRSHKKECPLLPIVWKVCRNQTTDLARLFVRMVLDPSVQQCGIEVGLNPALQPASSDMEDDIVTVHLLKIRADKRRNCLQLYKTWQPLLEALENRCDVYVRHSGVFLGAVIKLLVLATPIVPERNVLAGTSNGPVAYATFRNKGTCTSPGYKRNVVFVTGIDPVEGPTLQIKAVRPLETGEQMCFANAQNLLVDPFVYTVKSIVQVGFPPFADSVRMMTSYCETRVEVVCSNCGKPATKVEHQCSHDSCEDLCLVMCCQSCDLSFDPDPLVEVILNDMQELMGILQSKNELCLTSELEDVAEHIRYLITKLRPMVAPTSFPLGIFHLELAEIYEKLGQMDKCVEAYKAVIPVAEKHLDVFDQNIFDGLVRIIVFHLERGEVAESLPYIEKAWDRLRYIPGKDSFDFYVVDKLRTAVRNDPDFSFSKFCTAAPH